MLNTYDAAKQLIPNLEQHTQNNTNPNDTSPSQHASLGSSSLPQSEPAPTLFVVDVANGTGGGGDVTSSSVGTTGAGSITATAGSTQSQSSSTTSQVSLIPIIPLAAVDITHTSGEGLTTQAIQTISGTGVADSTVIIFDTYNGVTNAVGTTTVSASGDWTATVTLVGNGSHSIVALDNAAANASAAVVFDLEVPAPTVAIITAGGVANQPTQTISGTVTDAAATPGATVTLYDNGVLIGTTTVGANGSWSTIVALSGNGTHSIVAQDTDAAGNTGVSSPVVFTLNIPAPTLTIAAVEGNNVINAAEAVQGVALSGTVSGIAANGTFTVTVTDNGVTHNYTATVNAAGTAWSASIPSTDAQALANGTATVSAQVTDVNGNTATASQAVTVAETGPTLTINAIEGNNIINAVEASQGVPLSGTVSGVAANSTFTVTVTDNGVTHNYTATVNAAGTSWSATIPSSDAQALANGTATVSAQVTDVNGNVATAIQTVTVAETGPTLTIAAVEGNNIINAAEAAQGVPLSGTVSGIAANSTFTVTVTDNGVTHSYTATVNAAGTSWSATIPSSDATRRERCHHVGQWRGDGLGAGHGRQWQYGDGKPGRYGGGDRTDADDCRGAVEGNNIINAAQRRRRWRAERHGQRDCGQRTFTVTVTDNGVTHSYTATVNAAGTSWSATIPSSDATRWPTARRQCRRRSLT